MRFFSILAALVVTIVLAMSILARPQLMALLGMAPEATPAQTAGTAGIPQDVTADVEDTPDPIRVSVRRFDAQQVDSAVILRGQTEALREVDVRAETSASVVSDPLRKGARVEAGDPLCLLDAGTRGAALDEARARLSEAESRVPEAEARVTEAQSRLDEALINQNAATQLVQDGYATQTRVASTDAAVATARAGVSSATSGLNAARSGIQAATAAVASAEKEIERLTITAPFDGLLESDTAELGSFLQAGGLCATIIQLDPIKLVAFVPETEVDRVTLGAPARAQLVNADRELTGQVTFLSRAADPTTRTFRVEIAVPNGDNAIRDGQTVEIAIASAGVQAHLVPQSSLTLDDDGALGLRLVDDSDTVFFSPVKLMRDTVDGVWVTGLPAEANVIVVGQEYVTAGVTVDPSYAELGQ